MIDFLNQQEQIKNYIQTELPKVLEEANLKNFDAYITDTFDLDQYQKSKQLFFDFSRYSFDSLSNESNTEEITMHIYLTFKNDKSSVLYEQMLKYTSCVYEMFNRSGFNFGGIVDFGKVEETQFWLAAEANYNVKVADIQIKLQIEQ